jgi:hypothetical protein
MIVYDLKLKNQIFERAFDANYPNRNESKGHSLTLLCNDYNSEKSIIGFLA